MLAAILPACDAADNDPGPGGVSVGEARALDEAAEMIEARRLPPGTIRAEDNATDNTQMPGEEQTLPPTGEEQTQ